MKDLSLHQRLYPIISYDNHAELNHIVYANQTRFRPIISGFTEQQASLQKYVTIVSAFRNSSEFRLNNGRSTNLFTNNNKK